MMPELSGIQAAESAMDTQDAPKEAGSQTTAPTSNLPEAEAYATLLVTQYLVDNKLCSEVHMYQPQNIVYSAPKAHDLCSSHHRQRK